MSASPQIAVISSSVDVQFVSRLVTDLRAAGWNVLDVSKSDLADTAQHITHLQDVETFVLVLSNEALRSAWLTHEIERVLVLTGDEPADPSRPLHPPRPPRRVIPLRLMPLELPESLAWLEPVDFATVVYESALSRLQEALRGGGADEGNGAENGDHGDMPSSMPAPQLEPALISATTRDADATQTSHSVAAPSNGAPTGEMPIADPAAPTPPAVPPTAPMPQAPPSTGAAASATPPGPQPPAPAAPSELPVPALSVPDASVPDAPISDETGADETTEPPATQITASRFLRAETPFPPRSDLDDVMFTVFAPGEIERRARMRLLVYTSRETRDALAQVAADADARLAGARGELRPFVGQRPSTLRPGARLSLVPVLPGFAFDPPAQTVRWDENVQRQELYLRATTAQGDVAARGSLRVFAGPLLLAEVPLAIMVREPGERSSLSGGYASTVARAYRRIFASYAPRDADLARTVASAAGSLADDYLRDAIAARGAWDDRHMRAIAQAEVFQLFWSEHAAHSPEVEREWRYAASIRAPRGYLRGLYWSVRPYSVPAELRAVSFDALDPARAGLGYSLTRALLGRK